MAAPIPVTRSRVDDVVRKALGVSDIDDVKRVLESLARRYPGLDAKERQLSLGLIAGTPVVGAVATQSMLSDRELERARTHLVADLDEIVRSEEARERREEFQGWRDRLLVEFDAATDAAVSADDGQELARVFVACHTFTDFGAVARVSSRSYGQLRAVFRRLGTSLDRVTRCVLRRTGERMYEGGLGVAGVSPGWVRELRSYASAAVEGAAGLSLPGADAPADIGAWAALKQTLRAVGREHLRYYLDPIALDDSLRRLVTAVEGGGDPAQRRRHRGTAEAERLALLELAAAMEAQLSSTDGTESLAYSPNLLRFYQGLSAFLAEFDLSAGAARVVFFASPPGAILDALEPGEQHLWDVLAALVNERDRLARRIEEVIVENASDGEWTLWAIEQADGVVVGLDRLIFQVAGSSSQGGEGLLDGILAVLVAYLQDFAEGTDASTLDAGLADWFGDDEPGAHPETKTAPWPDWDDTNPWPFTEQGHAYEQKEVFGADDMDDYRELLVDIPSILWRLATLAHSP